MAKGFSFLYHEDFNNFIIIVDYYVLLQEKDLVRPVNTAKSPRHTTSDDDSGIGNSSTSQPQQAEDTKLQPPCTLAALSTHRQQSCTSGTSELRPPPKHLSSKPQPLPSNCNPSSSTSTSTNGSQCNDYEATSSGKHSGYVPGRSALLPKTFLESLKKDEVVVTGSVNAELRGCFRDSEVVSGSGVCHPLFEKQLHSVRCSALHCDYNFKIYPYYESSDKLKAAS